MNCDSGPFLDVNTTLVNCSDTNTTLVSTDNGSVPASPTMAAGLVTLGQRQMAKYVLYCYIMPVIAIIGIVGNTMSLSILNVNRRLHAFNTYLMALTSADILMLLFALARCIVLIVAGYPDVRYPVLSIYGEFYISLIFGTWLQRISNSFISVIAIERFVAVAFPFKVKSLAIENHPILIIGCIVLGTGLCQVPTVVLLDVVEVEVPGTNLTMLMYGGNKGVRYATAVAAVARRVNLVFLTVISMFVPLLIVSVSTITILICLKTRSTTLNLARTTPKDAKERETMTLTVLSLALIFTVCYIPGIIIYVIAANSNSEFYKREINLIAIAVDINIVCVCVNSASDFLIYVLRSKQFRMMFINKFVPCLSRPQGSPYRSSDAASSSFPNVNVSKSQVGEPTSASVSAETVSEKLDM